MRIKTRGILLLILNLSIALVLLYWPYVGRTDYKGDDRLVDMLMGNDTWWLALTPFAPLVLTAEASLLSNTRTRRQRIFFILQGIVFAFWGGLTYTAMNIQLSDFYFTNNYYLILCHAAVMVLWSLLLAVPALDRSVVNDAFKSLELFSK